jgi:hypothetical protein
VVRVDLKPLGRSRWSVAYAGAVIVASSPDPEHDAARALLALGLTGRMETWSEGRTSPRVIGDIERMAGFRMTEEDQQGLRRVKWRPDEVQAAQDGSEEDEGAMLLPELKRAS